MTETTKAKKIVMQHANRLTLREAHLVVTALEASPQASVLSGAIAKLRRCVEAAHESSKTYAYLIGNTRGKRPAHKWIPKLTETT